MFYRKERGFTTGKGFRPCCDRRMFSHRIQKVSGRAFHLCGWTWILENRQDTFYPRFIFTPKTGKNSLKLHRCRPIHKLQRGTAAEHVTGLANVWRSWHSRQVLYLFSISMTILGILKKSKDIVRDNVLSISWLRSKKCTGNVCYDWEMPHLPSPLRWHILVATLPK